MDVVVLKDGLPGTELLAKNLGLPLVGEPRAYYLCFENEEWVVRDQRQGKNFVIRFDLREEFDRMVAQKVNPKKDLLCRALCFKGEEDFWVIDGTLGVAKDSIHLISCGAKVIGVEKNPITYFLLKSAQDRLDFKKDQFEIINGKTEVQCSQWADKAQALYLDFMFENAKQKSAPKKNMAFLREISPVDDDVRGVIGKCLEAGIKRIVVKRPLKGSQLYDKPNVVLEGKLVRYDVYTR